MSNLFAELKRRNVVRVGIAYLVVGWVIMQIIDVIVEPLLLPDWTATLVLVLLTIGLPIALLFSWAFELTAQGLKKTAEVDADASITHSTGRKLDFMIIGALVVGLGYFVWESRFAEETGEPTAEAPVAVEKSIAVLPFDNLSGDAENAQFTNGLHDDLLTQLAKIRELKVISRTSVLEYRDTTKNMRTIGQELGVAAIMEGGVQTAGNRVRINVQLIDAVSDKHLWAETYDRELSLENIFDIQSEIARNIATALKATLGEEAVAFEREIPTESLIAYESYLKGRMAMETTDFRLESLEAARAHYEAAVAEDPGFALAWTEIAGVNDWIYWFVDRSDENRATTLAAAEQALALEPELAEAHFAMALYYYHGLLDYDRALAELAIAERGMSGTADYLGTRGAILRRSGNFQASLPDFLRAAELAPKNALGLVEAIFIQGALHRYSEASADADRLPAIPGQKFAFAVQKPYLIFLQRGDPDPALAVFDTMEDGDFGLFANPDIYFSLLVQVGRHDDALALLERAVWARWREFDSFLPKDMYRGRALLPSDPEAARLAFERALVGLDARLALAPQNELIIGAKGVSLAHLGRHDEAIAHARRAMEIMPLKRDALSGSGPIGTMVEVLAVAGRHEEALEHLDRYLSQPATESLRAFIESRTGVKGLEKAPGFAALVEKHGWEHEDLSVGEK